MSLKRVFLAGKELDHLATEFDGPSLCDLRAWPDTWNPSTTIEGKHRAPLCVGCFNTVRPR